MSQTHPPQPTHASNWPFVLGGRIVLLVVLLAVIGPMLAPHDPLAQTFAHETSTGWRGPPFPAFEDLTFPLGSDRFGRDTLSRLLWALGPTLLLVTAIAAIRVVIGITLGMGAGWDNRRRSRLLNGLITTAAAVPVLIVALAVITVIGLERGLLAFVVGLSLTGWAETARLVAGQTRLIRTQTYVDVARALGASDTHMLVRHVLRQFFPLLGMLFVLEMSRALLLIAALGFLGYFIGGGVWIVLSGDAIPEAARVLGMPELGQMLATALEQINDPTQLGIVGSVVFVIILGFNLLGEGLRRQVSLDRLHDRSLVTRLFYRFGGLLEQAVLATEAVWSKYRVRLSSAAILLILVGAGGLAWWQQAFATTRDTITESVQTIPGEHLWATERRDAQGTLTAATTDPLQPVIRWTVQDEAGFGGGPVVAADGTVYIASLAGTLYSIDPAGSVRWEATLPAAPMGSPALDAAGAIYVTDRSGTLSAFDSDGTLRWQFLGEGRETTSGPIVAPDGTIYYTRVDRIQAISPEGQPLWVAGDVDGYMEIPPRLSPDGAFVFLKDVAVRTADATTQPLQFDIPEADEFGDPIYLNSADGRTYYRFAHTVIQWEATADGATATQTVEFPASGSTFFLPSDAGVVNPERIWLLYSYQFADTRITWMDGDGGVLTNMLHPVVSGQAIAADAANRLYFCGQSPTIEQECTAWEPGSNTPVWQLTLEEGFGVAGGALVPGRMYVATENGVLFAIGEE